MEISIELKGAEQRFKTSIVGVTKQNGDGSDRQALLAQCRPGTALQLVREPSNPYDQWAVAVYNSTCQQLGYLPAGDRRLADHMDMGGRVSAKVVKVTGGPGLLGLIFKFMRKHYGCVIEIVKGDIDWEKITPYMDKSREIEKLLDSAKALEPDKPEEAVSLYRTTIQEIMALDNIGSQAAACRRARYPVNRLSLLLEKSGHLQAAYYEIVKYENFKDVHGLLASDARNVASRKKRLSENLNKSHNA